MEKEKINKIKRDLKKKLNEYMEKKNCTLQFILSKDNKVSDIIYANLYGELVLSVDPESYEITKLEKNTSVLDDILFLRMNEGKQIEFIADEAHDYLWYIIETYYTDYNMHELDVPNKKSMLKYLKYCKDNNITDFYIDKKFKSNPEDLIEFYDNVHDNFKLGEFTVTMSRDVFDRRNERCYLAFSLGCSIMHKMIKEYMHGNYDIVFDFCYIIADEFQNSDYYTNDLRIQYDKLIEYYNDNKEKIKKQYIEFLGTTVSPLVCESAFLKR